MFDAGECIIVLVFLCGNYVACVQCSARGTRPPRRVARAANVRVCVCAINKVEFPVGPIARTPDSVLKCLQLTEVFDLTIYVRRLHSDFEDSTTYMCRNHKSGPSVRCGGVYATDTAAKVLVVLFMRIRCATMYPLFAIRPMILFWRQMSESVPNNRNLREVVMLFFHSQRTADKAYR